MKVLFISHDATRTGAPIVLLHFLRWFKQNSLIPFEIILKNSGPLQSEFEAIAPTTLLNPVRGGPGKRILRFFKLWKIANRGTVETLKHRLSHESIGLVYANTLDTGDVLDMLSFLSCPILCHVHELEYGIQYLGQKNLQQILKHTDRFIAVAHAVRCNLERHRISPAKISVVHEFIPYFSNTNFAPQESSADIRSQLGIPPDAHIVVGSGTMGWRKGTDVFLQVAAAVIKHYRERSVHFVWIGRAENPLQLCQLEADAHNLKIDSQVHFAGEKSNPLDYYALCTVFALTSREDPFPLVCLEAGLLGKPFVCFAQAGGMPELLENHSSLTIPYLNVEQMAAQIVKLLHDPGLCERLGTDLRRRIENHHVIDIQAPKINAVIQEIMRV